MSLVVSVVVVVVVMALPSHAQLGESAHGTTAATQQHTTPQPPEDRIIVVEEDYEEVMEVEVKAPRRLAVVGTYQGCILKEDNFANSSGLLLHVNLTAVKAMHNLSNEWAACTYLCWNKSPASTYASVSRALNGSVDACSCHEAEDLEPVVEVDCDLECEECDQRALYYRVFCGVSNRDCYNRGSPLLPLSPLALALLHFLTYLR